jgi:predicted RNA binding protein YcfA (HicA-like mRNA interferase family)
MVGHSREYRAAVFGKSGYRSVSVPFHGNKDLGDLGKDILKEAGIK